MGPKCPAMRMAGEFLSLVGRAGKQYLLSTCAAPLGTRMMVWSFTPSRIGIMKSRRSCSQLSVTGEKWLGVSLRVLWLKGLRCIFGAEAAAGDEEKSNECDSQSGFHGIPCISAAAVFRLALK